MLKGGSGTRTALSEYIDYNPQQLYETPVVAVTALLKYYPMPTKIWEPACGPGNIVKVLRNHGRTVVATDLINYNWSPEFLGTGDVDFLKETKLPVGVEAIITNPPFKEAHAFVRHARDLCPLVIMLLRLAFYESEKRCDILDQGDLAKILCFRKRLPMMHRVGWEGKKANSGMAFAWFIWDRNHPSKHGTSIRRISWEREERQSNLSEFL